MKTMKVVAARGMKCPMEGQRGKYVTDSEPVEVPASAYYLRRLRDGSITTELPGGGSGAEAAKPVEAAKVVEAAAEEKKPI